jgi:type II secretory pathway pseudopilin PulG
MRRGESPAPRERGFSYIGLLALIVLIGILLARGAEVERTAIQHAHEQELLSIGHEYRAAIGRYVARYHRYPATLADLLGPTKKGADDAASDAPAGPTSAPDAQGVLVFRAIRSLYRDPMTNSTEWAPVPSPDGRVMGVASGSKREPLKKSGFDEADVDFDKAETYADWTFVYRPPAYLRGRILQPTTTN